MSWNARIMAKKVGIQGNFSGILLCGAQRKTAAESEHIMDSGGALRSIFGIGYS